MFIVTICGRLKLEGETQTMGVCTKERKGGTAEVLMATPCTNSLGGESWGHRHEGGEERSVCWKFATLSGRQRAAVDILMLRERTMVCMKTAMRNKRGEFTMSARY